MPQVRRRRGDNHRPVAAARHGGGGCSLSRDRGERRYCKHLFDNRHGTGQSVWDGTMRTTNLLIAGKTVVVAGFGWCGRGVAARAAGLGAQVIITETDPVRALEAAVEGYRVMPMLEAAPLGDIFVTVTGCSGIIGAAHFERMKDGALLANAGHFDVEVDKKELSRVAEHCGQPRQNIDEYHLKDGRRLYLLAEGRLVNRRPGTATPRKSWTFLSRCNSSP